LRLKSIVVDKCPRTKESKCQCNKVNAVTEAQKTVKAVCEFEHKSIDGFVGYATITQKPDEETVIKGIFKGLTPGKHGFHIHEFGDLSKGCESAGGHYNPHGVDHGDIKSGHIGDLGNVVADQNGVAKFKIVAPRIDLVGEYSVVGRAFVLHQDEDDLGKGGDDESLKTGNAGDRVACGVIRLAESLEEDIVNEISVANPAHPIARKDMVQVKEPDLIKNKIKYTRINDFSTDSIVTSQDPRDLKPSLVRKVMNDFYGNIDPQYKDKPIIIDKHNRIINGHHRLEAAKRLGVNAVTVLKVSDLSVEQLNAMPKFQSSKQIESIEQQWKNKLNSLLEAPYKRDAETFKGDPTNAYTTATTNTTPKYDFDPERDYSAGKSLGPIPTIQSPTEVWYKDGTLYIFYIKNVNYEDTPKATFLQKVKDFLIGRKHIDNPASPQYKKEILGYLRLESYEDGYKVKTTALDPSIQGQGRAIKLYIAFSAWKNVPLYSDYTQTPSAQRLWQSLMRRYPNRIVAYDQKTKKNVLLSRLAKDELYPDFPPQDVLDKMSHNDLVRLLGSTYLLKLLPDKPYESLSISESIDVMKTFVAVFKSYAEKLPIRVETTNEFFRKLQETKDPKDAKSLFESYKHSKDLLDAVNESVKQLNKMPVGDLINKQIDVLTGKALETKFIFAPQDLFRYLYFLLPDDTMLHKDAQDIAKEVDILH